MIIIDIYYCIVNDEGQLCSDCVIRCRLKALEFLEATRSENTVKRSRAQFSIVGEFISSTQVLYYVQKCTWCRDKKYAQENKQIVKTDGTSKSINLEPSLWGNHMCEATNRTSLSFFLFMKKILFQNYIRFLATGRRRRGWFVSARSQVYKS